jgi:hypothetical protein
MLQTHKRGYNGPPSFHIVVKRKRTPPVSPWLRGVRGPPQHLDDEMLAAMVEDDAR